MIAGQDRVARPLVDAGVGPDELAELTLGSAPPSRDLTRLRERRAALGLPATTPHRCSSTSTAPGSRRRRSRCTCGGPG